MQLNFYIIPQDIINEYNLTDISHKGKVYIKIQKGVYGLQKYEIISHDRFKNNLEKHGYKPITFNPLLWTHKYRLISSTFIFMTL